MKCRKCHSPVHRCDACKGQTRTSGWGTKLTCSQCRNTGYQCGTHGGHWQ